jgi:hypothetical protein
MTLYRLLLRSIVTFPARSVLNIFAVPLSLLQARISNLDSLMSRHRGFVHLVYRPNNLPSSSICAVPKDFIRILSYSIPTRCSRQHFCRVCLIAASPPGCVLHRAFSHHRSMKRAGFKLDTQESRCIISSCNFWLGGNIVLSHLFIV